VQRELGRWERPRLVAAGAEKEYPRIAGISSFGAGGANAHLIVQEYVEVAHEHASTQAGAPPSALIILSAKSEEGLRQRVARLSQWLESGAFRESDLHDIAYTLQVGREAMDHRVAFVAASMEELRAVLKALQSEAEPTPQVLRGHVAPGKEAMSLINTDEELQEAIGKWIERGKHTKLLELWVQGLQVDWRRLHEHERRRRIALPAYAFAKERYWLENPRQFTSAASPARLKPRFDTAFIEEVLSGIEEQSMTVDQALERMRAGGA